MSAYTVEFFRLGCLSVLLKLFEQLLIPVLLNCKWFFLLFNRSRCLRRPDDVIDPLRLVRGV